MRCLELKGENDDFDVFLGRFEVFGLLVLSEFDDEFI